MVGTFSRFTPLYAVLGDVVYFSETRLGFSLPGSSTTGLSPAGS